MAWNKIRNTEYLAESGGQRLAKSALTPALAVDPQGDLHMIFADRDDGGYLRHITRRPSDPVWREVWGLSRQKLRGTPAACFVGNTLHVVTTDKTRKLLHVEKKGDQLFSQAATVPGAWTKEPVSLAAHGDTLHMVHHDQANSRVWYSTFRGRWSSHVNVRGLQSRYPAIITQGGSGVQIWTVANNGAVRLSTMDPNRGGAFGPLIPLEHPRRIDRPLAVYGVPRVNTFMIASARPVAGQFGQDTSCSWGFCRAQDDGRATGRAIIPAYTEDAAPALVVSGKRTVMARATTNFILQEIENHDSAVGRVGVGIKILEPVAETFRRGEKDLATRARKMVGEMNKIYAPLGITFFQRTGPEVLDLPHHFLQMNAGQCKLQNLSSEQRALFSNRNGLQQDDIGIFVVDQIFKHDETPLGGCGSPKARACMMTATSGGKLMAHEVGHALGLTHTPQGTNIMSPTITNETTGLAHGQADAALRSPSAII